MLQPDPNEHFRLRRQKVRRRRGTRRVATLGVVVVAVAAVALGARFLNEPGSTGSPNAASSPPPGTTEAAPAEVVLPPVPEEIRGVHVTMALMTIEGKLDEYLAMKRDGLTTIELDVKDENGEMGFVSPHAALAKRIGAAQTYYDAKHVVNKIHGAGLYLIGRVVVFEDPYLASHKPAMAIQRRGGGVWTNSIGLGWSNPYDEKVWDYNVDIAEAAARAGFDEIMFDYIRFPTDGDLSTAVFPGKVKERKGETLSRFLAYARDRLNPLGVRISAAVFGLSAVRDLGIGQRPRLLAKQLDAIYPMVYPSHYGSGELGIDNPNASPQRTVALSLQAFRRQLKGTDTRMIPWLQDFSLGRTYTLADVKAQILAARRMKSEGFLLWNAEGVYTAEALGGD
jgi:hypothetical protein